MISYVWYFLCSSDLFLPYYMSWYKNSNTVRLVLRGHHWNKEKVVQDSWPLKTDWIHMKKVTAWAGLTVHVLYITSITISNWKVNRQGVCNTLMHAIGVTDDQGNVPFVVVIIMSFLSTTYSNFFLTMLHIKLTHIGIKTGWAPKLLGAQLAPGEKM